MSKQTEAMKLALEALEYLCKPIEKGWSAETQQSKRDQAITAMREALAEQPAQQEPVECANGCRGFFKHHPPAQRTWVGLTDEDFNSDMFSITSLGVCDIATIKSIAKDVEAKLREKNT